MEEQELIKKLIAKDEDAYRYAIKTYNSSMHYVASAIVGDSIADEVVQEAWVAIIRALPKFEGRSSLKTWILRIVSNGAKTRLRKESRTVSMGDANDMETLGVTVDRFKSNGMWQTPPNSWQAETPESLLASEQLRGKMEQVVDQLPEMQKTVLILREIEGLEMEEICKILDISESNSRVLLHRARTRLWETIDKFKM
jgi:RNA polymerase sigma-70 factor (ECF subfamily)